MIWLIGSKGMLGREVATSLTQKGMYFVESGHEVDITSTQAIQNFINLTETNNYLTSHKKFSDPDERKIKWIINCAAYTNVDGAEENAKEAMAINYTGVLNIARAARNHGTRLIHLSTDYVFNGKSNSPYSESEAKDPINAYGKSKSLGEDAVTSSMSQYYILRTSSLCGFYGKNFVYTMLRLFNTKDEIQVVNDQYMSPTFCFDLANIITLLIERGDKTTNIFGRNGPAPYGIYNYTNEGKATWCQFARRIYEDASKLGLVSKNCKISECSATSYGAAATRPSYSVLDKSKIVKALHIKIPLWETSLKTFLTDKRLNRAI